MSVLWRDRRSFGNPVTPSPVRRSASTVKSQLPVARWQSTKACVSSWVPSLSGNKVVAVLLAADETAVPTNGNEASIRPTPAITVASRIIALPLPAAQPEQNLRCGYSS
jgi:hypothetical protein